MGVTEMERSQRKIKQAFVPQGWTKRFKGVLGPYKQFLLQHPDKFKIIEEKKGDDFLLSLAYGVERTEVQDTKPWRKGLHRAWIYYCEVVPRHKRDFSEFISALPEAAAEGARRFDAAHARLASA